MTDRSAFDPFSPPPAAPVELTERAAESFGDVSPFIARNGGMANLYPSPDERAVAFIASELEAGLARKGIDV